MLCDSTFLIDRQTNVSPKLDELAELLGELLTHDPGRKVVSYWCMGMNQHTRGTWIQNLVYNLHLLTGQIGKPGAGPFSSRGPSRAPPSHPPSPPFRPTSD